MDIYKQAIKTTLLTGSRSQKVVIERKDFYEWWVMFDSGAVEVFNTAEQAIKAVKKIAAKGNKSITITSIEWRDVPEGWKPPTESGMTR